MPIIRLVRHGDASAGYAEHPDPGLSERGRRQADLVAAELDATGPAELITSPMARARETAAPLASRWGVAPRVEPAISEIPSPGLAPTERGPWLQSLMSRTWNEAPGDVLAWRDGIIEALLELEVDTIGFSHFVAINAALSVATSSPHPRVAHLDHCSVTVFDTDGGRLQVLGTGGEADTTVL